jgi:hypothetical protein
MVILPQIMENINKVMIDLQFPNFGSPEDFRGLEEVMSEIQEIAQKYEEEIKGMTTMECRYMKKLLITKFKIVDRLEK